LLCPAQAPLLATEVGLDVVDDFLPLDFSAFHMNKKGKKGRTEESES
jgi:hypothetical protein